MTTAAETRRRVEVPIAGGEVTLLVPAGISDSTLNKEIAGQDVVRKKLLGLISRLERIIGSNREVFICPTVKLLAITEEFLGVGHELRRFMRDFSNFRSSIPELEEAREDIRTFFYGRINEEIDGIGDLRDETFQVIDGEVRPSRDASRRFRKRIAKGAGVVHTELQKIFAHLFTRDPRNLYREAGSRSQQEILFLQFKRDVEITEMLYMAVRKLERYMRGAIVPSDLLQMIADKIERERSIACLFEADYELFLKSLVEEILERLLTELEAILDLDGIWYDDFESIQEKIQQLSDVCITFKMFYLERSGLREKVWDRKMIYSKLDQRCRDQIWAILHVFDTHRYRDIAASIRTIDQMLVDLEGTLLQWEKGIAQRAFARDEWRGDEPFRRRGEKSVTYRGK